MRLVATIGYTTLVFAENVDYAKVIEALSTAKQVEKSGWGNDAVYVPVKQPVELEMRLATVAAVAGESEAELPLIAQLRAVIEERNALQSKLWASEAKVSEFKKAAEAVKA